MKKVLAFLLTVVAVSLIACGCSASDGQATIVQKAEHQVGQTLMDDFKSCEAIPVMEVAQKVVGNKIIPFSTMVAEVGPGLLPGFGNTEITGFDEGATFGPMIGSIPFVGYVFTVNEAVDVTTFCDTLKNAADLRWNVCTEADDMVIAYSGNQVFFLMCPANFSDY